MSVHVICCLIQGGSPKKEKAYKKYFFEMTQMCVASLLKTGFPSSNVTCVARSKQHCENLSKEFGINVIHGPLIPKKYKIVAKEERGKGLFFYKPISYSSVIPKPIDNSVMVMTDVDALFVKNPESVEEIENDVWSQHSYTYLRPSRVARLEKSFVCPKLDDLNELCGYLGSKAQALLFLKYKIKTLPEKRLTSNFVVIKPWVYSKLIKQWKEMCDYLIRKFPLYCKGDQEILSSAIDYLKLSYTSGVSDLYTQQYNGSRKRLMKDDAQSMGINI